MNLPPLPLDKISLLLAVGAIIILLTSELSSAYYGQTTLVIDKQKLKNVGYTLALLYAIMIAIRLVITVASPY